MKIQSLLILVALIAFAHQASLVPKPFCKAKALASHVPLSAGETLFHDMADAFSGYNLNISLATEHSFASLSSKFSQLDSKNTYLPNIISHHV